jgi:hypothetical protein
MLSLRRDVVGVVAVLLVGTTVGCGGGDSSSPTAPTSAETPTSPTIGLTGTTTVTWQFEAQEWRVVGTPPPCPSPLIFTTPVDLSLVTSIVYPGQMRGGYYKPHGGFRFDGQGQTVDVQVVAPINATIYRGSRYLVESEVQYMFDFINACGIMYRFGHLLELSARLQQVAATLPAPRPNDSHTTLVVPGQMIAQGELLATAIGMPTTSNIGVDWGVFDLRARNVASVTSPWLNQESELDPYGICWFDNLAPSDAARVRSLPGADSVSGSMSEYC